MCPLSRLTRSFALGAAQLGVLAVLVPSAIAIDPPTISPVTSPATSASWTFTWSAPIPDPGYALAGFRGGIDGALGPVAAGGASFSPVPDGSHTFSVQAVAAYIGPPPAQGEIPPPAEIVSALASVGFTRDSQGPVITPSLPAPNGQNGWYAAPFTIGYSCNDASPPVSCPPRGP